MIKFFGSLEELEDYAGKVAFSCFSRANIAHEFGMWREDAVQSAILAVLSRERHINENAVAKVIVARIVRAAVFEYINQAVFADNGHYRQTGERYVEVDFPERFSEEVMGYEDEESVTFGEEVETLLAQKFAQAGVAPAEVYARIVVLRVSGYSYKGIALETGLDYDVVRVYASRARRAMAQLVSVGEIE